MPHFRDEETETQKCLQVAEGHIASQRQSPILNLGLFMLPKCRFLPLAAQLSPGPGQMLWGLGTHPVL
jgi:hypothetical protein